MFTQVTLQVKFEPAQSTEKVAALAEGIMKVVAAATALNPAQPLPDGENGIYIASPDGEFMQSEPTGDGFKMRFDGWQEPEAVERDEAPTVESALEANIDDVMCAVRDLVNAGTWRSCRMSYTTSNKVDYESEEEAQIARGDRARMIYG
ncbi:MAG: hypothetical protein ABFD89_22640 [Bryobacteraceae bacterium]